MATGYKSSGDIGEARIYDSSGFLFERQNVGSGSYNNLYCLLVAGWGYNADGFYGNEYEYRTSGDYYQRDINGTYWKKGIIVPFTYYTVGTSKDDGVQSITVNNSGASANIDENTSCTVYATPKSGYVIDTLGGIQQSGTGQKSITFTVNGDRIVSATSRRYYTIAYNANGGTLPSGIHPHSSCFANESYALSDLEPTRAGYKFAGWALSQSATSAAYQPGDDFTLATIPGTAVYTVMLYAVWVQYAITYDANGGHAAGHPEITNVTRTGYGEITIADAAVRDGYVFGGWNIGETTYQPGETYSLTEDVTATAVWIGHKGITTSVVLPEGAPDQSVSVAISPAPTDGGWNEGTEITATAPATGVGIVFDSWDVSVESSDNENATTFTMPDAAVSVIAIYRLVQINVTHNVDAASEIAVETGQLTEMVDASTGDAFPEGEPVYGQTARFTAPEPLEGFAFAGWYVVGSSNPLSRDRVFTLELKQDISIVARYSVQVSVAKDTTGGNGSFSVDGTAYDMQASVIFIWELGSSHQIAAIPADGLFFGGWKIDDAADASSLFVSDTVVIDNAHTYTATFSSTKVEVTVTVSNVNNIDPEETDGVGSLLVQGDGVTVVTEGAQYTVEGFTEMTLVAVPAAANPLPLFRIEEDVSGEDDPVLSKTSPVTVRISNTVRAFRAKWGNATQFSIAVSSANIAQGIAFVCDSQNVTSIEAEQDSAVTVTALPLNGYRFAGWYEDGARVADAGSRYTFNASRPISLVAHFEADAIAICAWEGGSEPKKMVWTSKVYTLPRPFDPVAARVDATGYPVTLTVGTYSSPSVVPERDHALAMKCQDGRRLQRMRPERFMRVSVESTHEVDAIVVGTNMAEVN